MSTDRVQGSGRKRKERWLVKDEEHYSANLARDLPSWEGDSEASSPKKQHGRTEVSYPGH